MEFTISSARAPAVSLFSFVYALCRAYNCTLYVRYTDFIMQFVENYFYLFVIAILLAVLIAKLARSRLKTGGSLTIGPNEDRVYWRDATKPYSFV